MIVINVDNKIKALEDETDRLETLLSNGDITEEEYYSRIYPIEYELECLRDMF
jgi:hypothetical protein